MVSFVVSKSGMLVDLSQQLIYLHDLSSNVIVISSWGSVNKPIIGVVLVSCSIEETTDSKTSVHSQMHVE